MTPSVVHVIPELSGGGGGRAALAAARAASDCLDLRHRFISLRPARPSMRREASSHGFELIDAGSPETVIDAVAEADITQIHFWSSPELAELLERSLPATRLLIWPHVDSSTPPQAIPPALAAAADLDVGSSPACAAALVRARQAGGQDSAVSLIPAVPGWDRVEDITRSGEPGFNIGYIGTVGYSKLHPRFAEMSAAIAIPEARFTLAGHGDALRSLGGSFASLGIGDRCRLLGPVDNVGEILADLDVFGYPLREDGTASSDLSPKEAMYAGVPPVVLEEGAGELVVEDGVTGLVAAGPDAYPGCIERLHSDPAERQALGEAAREQARDRWSPDRVGPLWAEAYEGLLDLPKSEREAPFKAPADPSEAGASRFLRCLGESTALFQLSMSGSSAEAAGAHEEIAECSPVIGYGGGGILEFARRYPDDTLLALWSGLFMRHQGHPALAAGEFARARRHGLEVVP